jgi:hypothetical protein
MATTSPRRAEPHPILNDVVACIASRRVHGAGEAMQFVHKPVGRMIDKNDSTMAAFSKATSSGAIRVIATDDPPLTG